ncbi:MAG: hypothetical protein SFV17_05400 [Candidatus Obscuribacter sp.]|nr:hypothetical protein [Candidatus Obscuribacter sp.]
MMEFSLSSLKRLNHLLIHRIKRFLIFRFVEFAAIVRRHFAAKPWLYKLLLHPALVPCLRPVGLWKAWYCEQQALRNCPAYRQFRHQSEGQVVLRDGWLPDFSSVPPVDKENYVRRFSLAERCQSGQLPVRGAVLDTSSGSTGKPSVWVRGEEERVAVAQVMQVALRAQVPGKQILFINAFALGPWATGMCVSYSVSREVLLISVGPDVAKILDVLSNPDLSPDKFTYVIAGYPPFLKMLVDSARGIVDWSDYQVVAFYGGESMSEGMRDYLLKSFSKVYGDYGASDLEINIAAENDMTVWLRRTVQANSQFRHAVNAYLAELPGRAAMREAVPHIFQYNPLDYLIESNSEGELLVTLCRAANASPKIRYNIHDYGFTMSYEELSAILKKCGLSMPNFAAGSAFALVGLPFLFHYGRSDLAAEYYGCKIPPAAIEKILFEDAEMAASINSFRLFSYEDSADHSKRLSLALEIGSGVPHPGAEKVAEWRHFIFEHLAQDSQDFREADTIASSRGIRPSLECFGFRSGSFADSDIRMKAKYVEQRSLEGV